MKKLLSKFIKKYYQYFRIRLYGVLSDKPMIFGHLQKFQPVLLKGAGRVEFGNNVVVGVINSPFFFNTTAYIEVRDKDALIRIGDNVKINNNLCLICDKTLIHIGSHVLIGFNVTIIDSDFHSLHPDERLSSNYECNSVYIGNNVFIGSDVKILKGVKIGDNSVIAAGSVVTKSFGANLVIGGNPAKQISEIN